jgi:hypothetical protein
MTRHLLLVPDVLLLGCGVETVGTAAVAAKAQVDATRQAEEIKADIQARLDAAAQVEKQRIEQAEAATRP